MFVIPPALTADERKSQFLAFLITSTSTYRVYDWVEQTRKNVAIPYPDLKSIKVN